MGAGLKDSEIRGNHFPSLDPGFSIREARGLQPTISKVSSGRAEVRGGPLFPAWHGWDTCPLVSSPQALTLAPSAVGRELP